MAKEDNLLELDGGDVNAARKNAAMALYKEFEDLVNRCQTPEELNAVVAKQADLLKEFGEQDLKYAEKAVLEVNKKAIKDSMRSNLGV